MRKLIPLILLLPLCACAGAELNQEVLSQLEGLAVVHAEEAKALTRWQAGYVLQPEDVEAISTVAADAETIRDVAKTLYDPYRKVTL